MQQVVFAVLEYIWNLNFIDDEEFQNLANGLAKRRLQLLSQPLLGPQLVGNPLGLLFELLCRKLKVLERLAFQLESLGFVRESDFVVFVGEKLFFELGGLKYILQLDTLFLFLAVLFIIFQLQSPVVVFPVTKDGLHVIQGVLVKARSVHNGTHTSVSWPSDFQVFQSAGSLIFVFWKVLLNEVVKFIGLGAKV
jgi:hypothetical protein